MNPLTRWSFALLAYFFMACALHASELVTPLRTAEDLLGNIKYSLDQGLFWKDEFYTYEQIRRIFSDSKYEIEERPGTHVTKVEVYGFPFLSKTKTTPDAPFDTNLSITRVHDPKNQSRVSFTLDSAAKDLPRFETVEAIFGKGWKRSMEWPNPHQVLLPTKGPHGNARIEYSYVQASHSVRIEMLFDAEGRLGSATFRIGQVD